MIKPRLMARHRRFDVAQRMRARKLTEQQRRQLPLGGETANQFVGPVLLDKPIEGRQGSSFKTSRKTVFVWGTALILFVSKRVAKLWK